MVGSNQSRARLGVDIGGTFTDVALETERGCFTTKVLTTPGALEWGVIEAIGIVLKEAMARPADLSLIIHGTTLATNALIERKGAHIAFLTTDGFRDTLQIATEGRFDVYDVNLDLPEPLVPRHLRLEVRERISATGVPLVPLVEADVEFLIDEVLAPAAIESVAVGFLHSYANPAHEQRVREILLRRMPDLSVSLSSDVSPEMREYERFSTTCANAYVQPLMGTYLSRLESALREMGIGCPLFLMQSGGGLTTVEVAIRFPVRLVESGPAGGAIFAGHLARQMNLERVLSFDMGGTTAKICMIDDFVAQSARGFEVARVYRFKKGSGIPLRVPVIEMVEIGAGGGSVASIDALGRIAVGPESAGSDPGPACYGRGGRIPTVTDADLVLGRMDPACFSGGRVNLVPSAAVEALDRDLGQALGLSPQLAAFAVSETVDTNMANAARVHAVENGKQLESRTLIAFGGAAPLHTARLADKLGIDRIVIPKAAGVGSCLGFLRATIAFEVVRSHYQRLGTFDHRAANRVFDEMQHEAKEAVIRAAPRTMPQERRVAYMRYVGQGSEIVVPLDTEPFSGDSAERLRRAFEDAYRRQYNRIVPGSTIEIISFGVTAFSPALPAEDVVNEARPHEGVAAATVDLFDSQAAAVMNVKLYRREELRAGASIAGPALITEAQTSTVVPACFDAVIDGREHIVLTRRATSEES